MLRGYETLNINVIPELDQVPEDLDFDVKNPSSAIADTYRKLRNVRESMIKLYNSEFLGTLISQATDKKTRYKPVKHDRLNIGDIVLIKEDNCKPSNYPLAIVEELQINDLGETTGAILFKGRTQEVVKRHSSTLIPMIQGIPEYAIDENQTELPGMDFRQKRKAALISREKSKMML